MLQTVLTISAALAMVNTIGVPLKANPTGIAETNVITDLKVLSGKSSLTDLMKDPSINPDISGSTSQYGNFNFITGRPFGNDLYLYFCFVNQDNKFQWSPTENYGVCIAFGDTSWTAPSFEYKALTAVGSQANYGNKHFAKYVVSGAFSNITVGAKNYYAIDSFGTYGSSFNKVFQVSSKMSFTVDDDKNDITVDLYKAKAVSIKNHYAYQWQSKDASTVVWTGDVRLPLVSAPNGLTEVDFGMFNMDVNVDKILGIQLSYDYITYNATGYYKEGGGKNNPFSSVTTYFDVPSGNDYLYSDDNDKLEFVSHEVHDEWISCNDHVDVTLNTKVTSWIPWWNDNIKHSFNRLIDMNNYPSDIDSIEKGQLEKHRADHVDPNDDSSDATNRRFAYLAETGTRAWQPETLFYNNGWDEFWGHYGQAKATCHEAMGQIVSKVMYLDKGQVYTYNTIDQATDPTTTDVTAAPTISLGDWLKYKSVDMSSWWDKWGKIVGLAIAALGGIALITVAAVWTIKGVTEDGKSKEN